MLSVRVLLYSNKIHTSKETSLRIIFYFFSCISIFIITIKNVIDSVEGKWTNQTERRKNRSDQEEKIHNCSVSSNIRWAHRQFAGFSAVEIFSFVLCVSLSISVYVCNKSTKWRVEKVKKKVEIHIHFVRWIFAHWFSIVSFFNPLFLLFKCSK